MLLFNRRSFLLGAAALSGCGFTPAYGPGGGARALQNTVLADAPQSREAHVLVRQLEDRLGRPNAARFGLSYAIKITEERMAITTDNITTRFNIVGRVTYALRELNGGAVLTTGSVDSFTGYSATGSTVATQAARRDAQERLMTLLADQLVARLMASAPEMPE